MRLTSLTLTQYGPFRAERITFDPTPGRINLLVAPNGAGKSVLRSAFCDLLFNIPGQTGMGFRYGYGGMRLLAEAIGPDGTQFAFGRRKGQGNTLLDEAGAPLEPATLARLLGPADRTLLERLFALDTERLRRGGEALLASDGAVADALLSAAGGLRQARQLRAGLEAARDALAPERRSQTRPFYAALDRFTDAQRRLAAAVQRPEARERQETEFRHLEAEREQARRESHAAALRLAQLERVRRVAAPLRQHDAAAAWLAAHQDAPNLPADTGARLARAQEDVQRADLLRARERAAQNAAAETLAGIACDPALLDAGRTIDALVSRAGAAAQAQRDIPLREAELDAAEERIGFLLRQLDIALPVARAAEAVPRESLVAEARRLFGALEKIQADLDRLPDDLAATSREIAPIEADLARLPAPLDTAALEREVRDTRRAGDPADRAQQAAEALAQATTALTAAQRRVPAWPDGGVALPVQPLPAYERLDAARRAAATDRQAAAAALAKLRQEDAADAAQQAKLAAAGPLPDAAAIAEARARREGGWRLIYRRAFTPAPPTDAEEADWAGEAPLPLAFERAVADADELADLRSREAGRVAQSAELTRLR
ncbi:MAG TPA: AAA family ATPase, partial [Acetobacteraceae bacterium]|nr:AAA family ATPase [Acetobacteraceae bacterium]